MAYFLNNGDTAQSAVVIKTLNAKTYIIPGVTTNDEVTMPAAETLNYWVPASSAPSASQTPGAQQTFTAKALVKKSVSVTDSQQLNGVIPGINVATVSADQVNTHVVKDTVKAANAINRDYISKLATAAHAATAAYSAADVYGSILSLRAEFITDNKADYLEPTACFVAPEVYALLTKNNLIYFKDNSPAGSFLDMTIIECPDLGVGVNAIMMNQVAMVSGVSFTDTTVFDAAPLGYAGGTAYIGEIAYVNKATEFSADFTSHPILKF